MLAVESRRVADLSSDPRNVRIHATRSVEAIRKSLERFGQQKPIVVNSDGVVIAGNGTLEAARLLGWESIAVVVTNLSPAAAREFSIADNRTAELSEWDEPGLAAVLREIGHDSALSLGFDDADLTSLLADDTAAATGPDTPAPQRSEELSKKWGVKPGQVWSLGEHRLACGDSTDAAVVQRLLGKDVPFLMVTDPPYGVEYDAAWRNDAGVSKSKQVGQVRNDDRASWAAAFRHFPGAVAYVWHAARFASEVERSLLVCGFEVRAQIVWVKPRFAISRGNYHWRHEPCWYAVRRGASAKWVGGRKKDTAWADIVDGLSLRDETDLFAARVDAETVLAFEGSATTVWSLKSDRAVDGGHSTQKPVEAMARPIRNHGRTGDVVYEPFAGTGTTLVACEQTGRRCRAVELDPGYVAVVLERWTAMGGGKPKKLA